MKKFFLSAAALAVVAVSAIAVAPTTSEAVPAYLRQTSAACLQCHFQAIPRLAAFGRNFKIGGMRDISQDVVEDDHLSLGAEFNAALMFKARATHTSAPVVATGGGGQGGTGASNAIQWPDEVALFVGGRYGEHVGGLTEISIIPVPGGSGVANYKLHYVVDSDMGPFALSAGSTDGHGPAFILNDPSNTVTRNTRGWANRLGALDASGISGGATGVGAYAFLNDMIYIGAGLFTQGGGGAAGNAWVALDQLGGYLRLAVVADIAGLDTVIGLWAASPQAAVIGTTTAAAQVTARASSSGKSLGLDLQMQGDVGDLSIGFYLPVVIKGKQVGGATDRTGWYPVVTIGLGHMGVRFGYESDKTDNLTAAAIAAAGAKSTTTKTTMIGAWYSLAQNVELGIEYNSVNMPGAAANVNTTELAWEYVY